MRTDEELAFRAFHLRAWLDLLSILFIRREMEVVTTNQFYVSMDCIIAIAVLLWLQMQIIDILSNNGHIFLASLERWGQLIDEDMYLVRLEIYSHLVDGLNPVPNRFWILIIEIFSDKLLRFILLSIPLKFLIVKAVLSSESWNSAWSWDSSTSDNQNILIF